MREIRDKKKYMLAFAALAVALAAAGLISVLLRGASFGESNPNLALKKGVKATCDSVEQEALSAAMAIDGNDTDRASRWSSENNREDASHYIRLEFPEEISVSFVVLKWERANAVSYALQSSADGEVWHTLQKFETAPETLKQEIVLDKPVQTRYLRLSTYAVSKEEADFSDLYQNVSLYEFEVYGDKPTAYKLETPVIETAADGTRRLVSPEAPDGFQVSLIGADLEQVIGADGRVYDTIQDKDVTVGYLVEDTRGREEPREVSFQVTVPAAPNGLSAVWGGAADDETGWGFSERPDWVIPSIAEWRSGKGVFYLEREARIIVGSDDQAIWDVAMLLSEYCKKQSTFRTGLTVCRGTEEDAGPGDFYLGYAEEENGLGEEGYTCDITDKCVIKAETATGIRWGTVTMMQILFTAQKYGAPQGQIRDYPLYEVRGFGIDVARKPVSLDTLYTMMETMSWYKMNDLTIHLNDNEILATSGLADSAEHAMTAQSAFRLESSLTNGEGKTLTSEEYAYTKEEFAAFIATAKTYGVTVVPEIDTPAHSLSITKLHPEYALRSSNESVDQIDLGNEDAVAFVEKIWQEMLAEDTGAFWEAQIAGIGMDEYYGDGEQYRQYLTRINELVQETGKTVRLWGSLSNMGGTTKPSPENLQMNIWSTAWADPREMYEDGYSLINMQNNHLYIIPGGGYDRLDIRELYENWMPNRFYDYNRIETIPSYSPQMLGASYMIWNDMSGSLDVGISECDLFDRFFAPLGVIGGKLWGSTEGSYQEWQARFERLGLSPGSNPYAAPVWEGDALQFLQEETLSLSGQSDYVVTGYTGGYGNGIGVGGDYTVSMDVYREPSGGAENGGTPAGQNRSAMQEEILFETGSVYGQTAFKAVQTGTGQVGFSREGRDYSFNYTLPAGEWVNLTVRGEQNRTSLYVNGELVDTLGDGEPFGEYADFVFPLERIGSRSHSFCGMIKEIEVKANGGIY